MGARSPGWVQKILVKHMCMSHGSSMESGCRSQTIRSVSAAKNILRAETWVYVVHSTHITAAQRAPNFTQA